MGPTAIACLSLIKPGLRYNFVINRLNQVVIMNASIILWSLHFLDMQSKKAQIMWRIEVNSLNEPYNFQIQSSLEI